MQTQNFDVAIVGGGPAGASCAIALAGSGLQVALIDKAVFPRDKTCGDALGIDVINQLSWLSEDLAEKFKSLENKIGSYGIKVFSPDHSSIAIPLIRKATPAKTSAPSAVKNTDCGYVIPRIDFDNFLFQHAKAYANIHCFENTAVESILINKTGAVINTKDNRFSAKMLIGADGAHSIVAKYLTAPVVDKNHYSAGLRVYYKGVTGFESGNMIELHFFKDVIPGYLWLFPLADNKANVGIGMLSSAVSKKKVNLKETLQHLITTHPKLKERFANAEALETIKGYGLPLGSKKRKLSGDHFLLAGDAAGLIDPLSGEGIANSIRSGRIAAKQVMKNFDANDFSAAYNKAYDKTIYAAMWKEFKVSLLLQKLTLYPWLCNLAIRKANSVQYIRNLFTGALGNIDKRRNLFFNPKFYYKLFLGKRKVPADAAEKIL